MSHESREKMSRQSHALIIGLVVVTVMLVIALTLAWLFENKGLQTMTKIQFQYLDLYETNDDVTIPVELGKIDVRSAGEKRIPFRVRASEEDNFILQLGYTTNLPLTYQIKEVEGWNATNGTTITGQFLNKSDNGVANGTEHTTTYENYNSVQTNAEPIYWQSEPISRGAKAENVHDYILIVSWQKCDEQVRDKETDMIYLTAGIPGGNNEAQQ